jgi:hypothetical protein
MAVLTPKTVYASGIQPAKNLIIQLLEQIMGSASAPAVVKLTRAQLEAVTPASETYGGAVLDDPDPTNNGLWYRNGGAWEWGRGFPDTFAVLTGIGGTANAITASTEAGVNPADILCVMLPDPPGTNSSSTVTLTLNGGSAENVKAASGANLAIGDIIEGVGTVFFKVGSEWRQLFSSATGATFDHQGDYAGGTTYTEGQVVTGSDGKWYQLKDPSATGDDPVGSVTGAWLEILAAAAVADGAVTEPKHATGGVSTRALADASVTRAKLSADVAASLGVIPVATRTALAALDTTVHGLADLTEVWREGRFRLRLVADLSVTEAAALAVDDQQGVFVASTDDTDYVWQRIYSGALNVNWFGVPGDLSISKTDTYAFLDDCWYVALELGHDIYHPAGIYDCGENNFPYRQKSAPVALLDCKNITIFGDGPATILRTESVGGADVLQLYGLKNIRFRDFRITSDVSGTDFGSNGISIVGGFDNIEVLDVAIGPLRSLDRTTYIDGGKAVTFQSEAATLDCGRAKLRYSAYFCAQAFGYESDLVNMQSKDVAIDVDLMAERCGTGVLFVAAAATGAVPAGFQSGIKVKAHLTNCQRPVSLNRAHGIQVDATVVDNAGAASTKATDFWGNFYRASDIQVVGLTVQYAKNSQISFIGDVGHCTYGAAIGDATAGSSGLGGNSQFCEIFMDFTCTPSVSIFNDPTAGGAPISSSRITISGSTAPDGTYVPATWKDVANANIVYLSTTLL